MSLPLGVPRISWDEFPQIKERMGDINHVINGASRARGMICTTGCSPEEAATARAKGKERFQKALEKATLNDAILRSLVMQKMNIEQAVYDEAKRRHDARIAWYKNQSFLRGLILGDLGMPNEAKDLKPEDIPHLFGEASTPKEGSAGQKPKVVNGQKLSFVVHPLQDNPGMVTETSRLGDFSAVLDRPESAGASPLLDLEAIENSVPVLIEL